MSIKSNPKSEELNNPFYIANKRFCEEFEKYIISRNGQVKGTFNVWAYYLSAKINSPKEWVLSCKKSNYTSLGITPLLQSKKEYENYTLSLLTKWETKIEGFGALKIRRKMIWDIFTLTVNKNALLHPENRNYIIFSNKKNEKIVNQLTAVLKPLFDSGEIFQIIINNKTLSIQINTDSHHFNLFERLEKIINQNQAIDINSFK